MMNYEIVVIGGGPGGYVAAKEAAEYSTSVALIESGFLGGTCLNTGCIPSKTLLRQVEVLDLMKKASDWGINFDNISVSFAQMMKRKSKVVGNLRLGVQTLLTKANVKVFNGKAMVGEGNLITIDTPEGSHKIRAEKIILATGSSPYVPPIKGLDTICYHTTDTIFDMEILPSSMIILGGGIIGVEMATIFSS